MFLNTTTTGVAAAQTAKQAGDAAAVRSAQTAADVLPEVGHHTAKSIQVAEKFPKEHPRTTGMPQNIGQNSRQSAVNCGFDTPGVGDPGDHAASAARRAAIIASANIIQNPGYTPVRMTANAVVAFSQAHSENRVYRSGNPAGAIFICGDGAVSS
jgi:hypothetical protein